VSEFCISPLRQTEERVKQWSIPDGKILSLARGHRSHSFSKVEDGSCIDSFSILVSFAYNSFNETRFVKQLANDKESAMSFSSSLSLWILSLSLCLPSSGMDRRHSPRSRHSPLLFSSFLFSSPVQWEKISQGKGGRKRGWRKNPSEACRFFSPFRHRLCERSFPRFFRACHLRMAHGIKMNIQGEKRLENGDSGIIELAVCRQENGRRGKEQSAKIDDARVSYPRSNWRCRAPKKRNASACVFPRMSRKPACHAANGTRSKHAGTDGHT
jgi:hypothetical protein